MDGDSKQDHRDPKGESKEEDAKAINALAALPISLLLLAFLSPAPPWARLFEWSRFSV